VAIGQFVELSDGLLIISYEMHAHHDLRFFRGDAFKVNLLSVDEAHALML
jgi:hypothetical protein